MSSVLQNILSCFKPKGSRRNNGDPARHSGEGTSGAGSGAGGGSGGGRRGSGSGSGFGFGGRGREGMDGPIWFLDNGNCSLGEFSMAVVQANMVLEDQCRLESGPLGTFVGIYDGHGGHDAARYVCDNLFDILKEESAGGVTERSVEAAVARTEEGFRQAVEQIWNNRTSMATCGTCCLLGVIYQQTLYVANLGDSRVLLGSKSDNSEDYVPSQLSEEHNVKREEIRRQLQDSHPNDPQVVEVKRGAWRVKGIIQVSRSIGDVYLKDARFNRAPIPEKFRLTPPMDMPYLSATPEITIRRLTANDSFLVFASDGLWEFLTNAQVVHLVRTTTRTSIARKLVKAAMREAASRKGISLSRLEGVPRNERRSHHDDISVIVLFLNHGAGSSSSSSASNASVNVRGPTTF